MNDFQFGTITGPLLEILAHMGKEDMSELAESLVNITSLKRKFTSSDSGDESVGGPVVGFPKVRPLRVRVFNQLDC